MVLKRFMFELCRYAWRDERVVCGILPPRFYEVEGSREPPTPPFCWEPGECPTTRHCHPPVEIPGL
jgi:hypothetical protein